MMQVNFDGRAVHGLPDIVQTEINNFFEHSFIYWRQVMQLNFSLSLELNFDIGFVDDRFFDHCAFLIED